MEATNVDKMIEILQGEQYITIHKLYWGGPGGWINLTDINGERYRFTDRSDIRTFVSTLKEILYINSNRNESSYH